MSRRLALTLVLFAGLVPDSEALTLDEAISRAVSHSNQVEAAEAGAEAARAEASSASRSRLPRVGLDLRFHRTDDPVMVFGDLLRQGNFTADNFELSELNSPSPLSHFEAGVTLQQPIWTGGNITSRIRAGEASAEAAMARVGRSAQEIAYRTEQSYRRALLADERLELLRRSLALAQTQAARVESLWAVGLALQSDRQALTAHVQETAATLSAAEAESVESRSLLGWLLGVGEPVWEELQVPSNDGGSSPPSLEEALYSLENRGDLRASQQDELAAEAGKKLASSELLPNLDAVARAAHHTSEFFGEGQAFWFLGVQATWAFDWGSSSRVDAAESRIRQASLQVEETRDRARHEVRVAYTRQDSAIRRLAALEAAVAASENAYQLIQKRHVEGLATTLELTEAQNTLIRVRLELAAARHDLALARKAAELAAGTLETPEVLP